MAVYLVYLIFAGLQLPLFYRRDSFGQKRFNKKWYVILCGIEIILLASLRGYTVGADTQVYLKALEHYGSLSSRELLVAPLVYPFDFEFGYFWLTKISALLGIGKTEFLFLISVIIYIPVFANITRYSSMPYFSILSYFAFGFFSLSLGIFRQMIAISILFCGWEYIRKRKLIKFLLVMGLAMLFHTTAVISLLLYILYGIKWERVAWLIIPAELLLLVFGRSVVLIAFKLMPQYSGYLDGKYDIQGGSYVMLMVINVILFACIFINKKGRFNDDITICALILAVLLQAIGYSMAIFGRIVPYYSIYIIFALPNIVNGFNKSLRRSVNFVVIIGLFLMAILEFSGNEYVTPYYTFFQLPPVN